MAIAIGRLAFSFSIFTGDPSLLATQVKVDQPTRSSIKPLPHNVVQQPAAKELKKSPEIPSIGLILSSAAC
jgi:hypothetical protein